MSSLKSFQAKGTTRIPIYVDCFQTHSDSNPSICYTKIIEIDINNRLIKVLLSSDNITTVWCFMDDCVIATSMKESEYSKSKNIKTSS